MTVSFSVGLHKRVRYEHFCTEHLFVISFCVGGVIITPYTILERLNCYLVILPVSFLLECGVPTVKFYFEAHTEQRGAVSLASASTS